MQKLGTEIGDVAIGGVADVCVHPQYRGRGFVHQMLKVVHEWLSSHDFSFALLFGDPRVYASSGHVPVDIQPRIRGVVHHRLVKCTDVIVFRR